MSDRFVAYRNAKFERDYLSQFLGKGWSRRGSLREISLSVCVSEC